MSSSVAASSSASSLPATYPGLRLTSFVTGGAAQLPALAATALPSTVLTANFGADEVIVRVSYASVNPSDVKNALGFMAATTKLPRTLGRDFSGRVVQAGASVSALLNQEVFGTGGDLGFTVDGAHAEYLRLPATGVALKPASLKPAEAATVGVAYTTAAHGLARGRLTADDFVLVTGANGGVGSAVVQLAKLKGAKVIAVERARPKQAATASAGPGVPDATIYLSELANGSADLGSAVRALPLLDAAFASSPAGDPHHRRGPTLIFDVVGGEMVPHLLGALATRGRLVCIAMPLPAKPLAVDGLELYRQELEFTGVNSLLLSASDSAKLLREIVPAFEDGRLATRDASTTTLVASTNIGQAYADVIGGKARGKIVLDFTGQTK